MLLINVNQARSIVLMSHRRYLLSALLTGILRVSVLGSMTTLTGAPFVPSLRVIVAVLIAETPDFEAHRI
jgi:flagellar biosynthesis protein FliQ